MYENKLIMKDISVFNVLYLILFTYVIIKYYFLKYIFWVLYNFII